MQVHVYLIGIPSYEPARNTKTYKIRKLHVIACIFHILRYFATKLHNFTKFRMLFPAVLMIILIINFPNSKVCLIGELSIEYNKSFELTR